MNTDEGIWAWLVDLHRPFAQIDPTTWTLIVLELFLIFSFLGFVWRWLSRRPKSWGKDVVLDAELVDLRFERIGYIAFSSDTIGCDYANKGVIAYFKVGKRWYALPSRVWRTDRPLIRDDMSTAIQKNQIVLTEGDRSWLLQKHRREKDSRESEKDLDSHYQIVLSQISFLQLPLYIFWHPDAGIRIAGRAGVWFLAISFLLSIVVETWFGASAK